MHLAVGPGSRRFDHAVFKRNIGFFARRAPHSGHDLIRPWRTGSSRLLHGLDAADALANLVLRLHFALEESVKQQKEKQADRQGKEDQQDRHQNLTSCAKCCDSKNPSGSSMPF